MSLSIYLYDISDIIARFKFVFEKLIQKYPNIQIQMEC